MAKIATEILRAELANEIESDSEMRRHLCQSNEVIKQLELPKKAKVAITGILQAADNCMMLLLTYYHGAVESGNQEYANDYKIRLNDMWQDIKELLRSPTLETLQSSDLYEKIDEMTKLNSRLRLTKEHLSHFEPARPKKKRRAEAKATQEVQLANKFQVLQVEENPETMEEGEIEDPSAEKVPSPDIQKEGIVNPIYINLSKNWRHLLEVLNTQIFETEASVKLVGEALKVTPKTISDFRKAQAYLEKEKIPFHAMNVKAERPKKVIIRGLPEDSNLTDLAAELVAKGVPLISSYPMRKRGSKEPMPLFLTTLRPEENWENVYQIDRLMRVDVVIVPYNPPTVRQCYRCQRFGHSSFTCTMPERCVRCAGNHLSAKCPVPRDGTVKPRCVNCGGEHPANYGGCPKTPTNVLKDKQKTTRRQEKSGQYVPAPPPKFNAWTRRPVLQEASTQGRDEEFPPLPTKPTNSEVTLESTNTSKQQKSQIQPPKQQKQQIKHQNKPTVPQPERPQKPKQAPKQDNSFTDMVREIVELFKSFNIADMLKLFKSLSSQIKNAESTSDKIYILIQHAGEFFSLFSDSP